MTERTYRTFKSWDEVSPGDTLLWFGEDGYLGTSIEFTSYKPGDPYNSMYGKALEVPEDEDPDDYTEDGWSVSIYPEKYDGLRSIGWVIEDKIFKYDPTQQPEDDSI